MVPLAEADWSQSELHRPQTFIDLYDMFVTATEAGKF